jgi:quinol monooxygenase YgiN
MGKTKDQPNARRAFLRLAGAGAAVATVPALRTSAAAQSGANEVITAVTFIHGIRGREEDLRQHLLSLARPTRSEPGCVAYDLYQSPEAAHEFMRYEVWASPAALEAHKKTPHLQASFEKRQREGWSTQITVWKRVVE